MENEMEKWKNGRTEKWKNEMINGEWRMKWRMENGE